MINIVHKKDPAGISKPDVYSVAENTNILDWLNATFDSQNDLCGDLACSFVLNGKEIFRSDHEEVDHSILDITISSNDQLIIINRPAGVIPIVLMIISIGMSIYTYMNMPNLPGAEEARNESPNNRLNAATNQFRPGMAIPECFGSGVSYPDFIQPSYYYYANNKKLQVGFFCITAGEALIDEVRVGDTDINQIPESSATVFGPFTKPDNQYLVVHQAATNIDGQVLTAPNDDSLVQTSSFDMTASGGVTSIVTTLELVQDTGLLVGSNLYIRSTWLEFVPDPDPDIIHYALDGVFPITAIVIVGDVATIKFNYNYTDNANVDGELGRAAPDTTTGEGSLGELDYWIGPFDTPGEKAEEVMVHWQAPQGVRNSDGGIITLAIRIEIENIETGAKFIKDASVTENTYDAQFVTTVLNKAEFPGMTTGQYRVRARRLTNVIDFNAGASELMKLEGFVSVTPYNVPHFGDVTTLLTQRRATLFSPDQSSQKINCDYRRKLPTYNRIADTYDLSDLQPTKTFADAVAYTLISSGNETATSVNLAELYGIYDGLSNNRLGNFTFTFDDADLSMGERVESISNVARVMGFHDGRQWRFARDEAKPVRAALFNRRSVTGNNAKQAWQPQRDDDADSVRILYVDPVLNTESFTERKFDINTGSIVSGEVGINTMEIKLAGCRDDFQASNRADLEVRRIAYQRRSVRETTYRDALELELLDRVGWVDVNDIDTFDGEVMGIGGNDYDTSEGFYPEMGKSYVVFLTDEEGYPSNTVPCEPRLDTVYGFNATGISSAYIATGDQQVGSRYFIADADDLASSNFTLKSRKPNAGGTVEIELIEYRPEMYEKDDQLPADDAPIIGNGLVALGVAQDGFDSSSTLTLEADGQIDLNGTNALWYSGGVTIGIGASFEAFATIVSGTITSGPLNQWVTINNTEWVIDRVGSVGVSSARLEFEIRQIDHVENKVINTMGIDSAIVSAVALPATIDVDVTTGVGISQARVDFLSNGEFRETDGGTGSYTTIVDGVGALYEVKATNLVGALDLGVADVWVPLGGAGASYSITVVATEVVTFDVELREIADVLNTTSSAVTLSVTL